MKKILTILAVFLSFVARSQTIPPGALPWKFGVGMEYWSGLVGNNDTLYIEQDGESVGSYPTAFPLPGGRLVKSASGGFNRFYVAATDGTLWFSSDYNGGRSWTQIPTDSAGNSINNAIQVVACTNTYIYQRSSDSAWLYGGTDSLGMFYALSPHPNNFAMRALPLVTTSHIRKMAMTTFSIVGCAYNNDTVFAWLSYVTSPALSATPTKKLVPTGSTGHIVDVGVLGSNIFNDMILGIVSTNSADTAGNMYAYGGGSGQWGGGGGFSSLTSVESIWSAGPWKIISVTQNATHAINYRGRLYGTGQQVQGEVGNGVEFVNRYTYPNWPNYNWDFNGGENVLSGVAPIDTAVGFKWICDNGFFMYYKLAMDSAGNVYHWGRAKSLVQWSGEFTGLTYNQSQPNLIDNRAPKIVVPAGGPWAPLKQYGTVTLPARGAGSNQTITTSSTTIANTGNPVWIVNSNSPFDTLCCHYSTFSWVLESGPTGSTIVSPTSKSTVVNFTQSGVYRFRVLTTDQNQGMDTASVQVTVNISAIPTVSAGSNQTITLPVSSVTLAGSASANSPATSITTYLWSQVSGPSTGNFSSTAITNPTFSGLTSGTYVLKLTVTDNLGNSNNATVTITVNPIPVVVTATASPTNITLPTSTTNLSGTVTYFFGTTGASTSWTLVSKPSGAPTPSIVSGGTVSIPTAVVSGMTTVGTYVYKLTAVDVNGNIGSVTVNVMVAAAPSGCTNCFFKFSKVIQINN